MSLGFLMASLACLLSGGGASLARWVFRRRAVRVVGRVTARKRYRRGGAFQYAPIVAYTHEGAERRFESQLSGTACPELGAAITVLVDPREPERVQLEGWDGAHVVAGVFYVGAAVFGFLWLTVD